MDKRTTQPPTGGAGGSTRARWLRLTRQLVPTGAETLFGLGLGLYLAWVDNMFYGARVMERDYSPFRLFGAGDVLYYVSIVTLLALLGFLAWRGVTADRVLYARRTCTLGATGMVLSTLLILSTLAGGAIEAVCIPVAGVLSALASGVCLMQWCRLASGLGYREIVVTGAFGYVFSKALVVVAQAGGAALRVDVPVAIVVMTTLNCLMAGGSGLIFAQLAAVLWPDGGEGGGLSLKAEAADGFGVVGGGVPTESLAGPRGEEGGIVVRMAAALVVVGFTPVLARGIGLGLVCSDGATPGLWYVELHFVSLLVMAAAAVLIAACFLAENTRKRLGECYRLITLFALAGALFIPLPFIFGDAGLIMPGIWASSSFNCLHIVMWIVVAAFGRAHREFSTRYFALTRIGWALGPLFGELANGLLWHAGAFAGEGGGKTAYLLAVGCALGVYLVYAYLFPERSLARALDVMPRRVKRPFQERCRALARGAGLSEREFEIMMYFAKGRDAAYIQRELVLTHSTISSHRQHIYAKLGVHSQQELLSLLGGTE